MGSTLASIDATLKEVYEGDVRRQLQDEIVALKRITRSSDGVSNETNGKYVTFPVHVRRNGGLGSRNEAEVLPTPGQQGYAAARLALKSGYLGIELTGHSIDMSDTNPKAFAKSLDEEMERGRVDFKKDLTARSTVTVRVPSRASAPPTARHRTSSPSPTPDSSGSAPTWWTS